MKTDIILQLSVRSIRLHFLRSVLAALGIVIGVVAISSMGMMGANMTMSVTEQLSSMANVLVVRADTGGGGGGFSGGPSGGGVVIRTSSSSSASTKDYLTKSEFDDIERVAGKYGTVYPLYQDSDKIVIGGNSGRATVYGMRDSDMVTVLTIEDGALPNTASAVVVGPSFAERHEITIGSRITIGDETLNESVQKFRVVGILKEKGMSMDLNSDNAIIMGEKSFVGQFGGEGEYDQVNVILNDINDANTTTTAIENQLNRNIASRAKTYRYGPEFLRQIKPATLYLWGEADPFGGVEIGEKNAAAQPNAMLRSFPAAGHLPWLDDPATHAGMTRTFLRAEKM